MLRIGDLGAPKRWTASFSTSSQKLASSVAHRQIGDVGAPEAFVMCSRLSRIVACAAICGFAPMLEVLLGAAMAFSIATES
ncbi:hypothetical protein [uncultured Paracoccus sp.]|uniref:hypothetical protein n=1 Tax=uncultured Paracoccus sp. TaxID=189685 RepID=UPI0026341874|nr:hypothetical protein [uncultured Paracoccus sp.]